MHQPIRISSNTCIFTAESICKSNFPKRVICRTKSIIGQELSPAMTWGENSKLKLKALNITLRTITDQSLNWKTMIIQSLVQFEKWMENFTKTKATRHTVAYSKRRVISPVLPYYKGIKIRMAVDFSLYARDKYFANDLSILCTPEHKQLYSSVVKRWTCNQKITRSNPNGSYHL